MHVERVTRGIALLRRVHRDHQPFDIGSWFADDIGYELDCGTAACAVGWMARDPWMQDQGLGVVDSEPAYLGQYSYMAVEAFLEITFREAKRVFTRSGYDNPANVTANDVADLMQEWLGEVKYVLAPEHKISPAPISGDRATSRLGRGKIRTGNTTCVRESV